MAARKQRDLMWWMRRAILLRAREMLSSPVITGQEDPCRAASIVRRLATDPAIKRRVWAELCRRTRVRNGDGEAAPFFYIRKGSRSPTEYQRIKQAKTLFDVACLNAVSKIRTKTTSELEAEHAQRQSAAHQVAAFAPDLRAELLGRVEGMKEPPEYSLRTERSRTPPEQKGYVIALTLHCEVHFGSRLPSAVAEIARVALGWQMADVREMVRSIEPVAVSDGLGV